MAGRVGQQQQQQAQAGAPNAQQRSSSSRALLLLGLTSGFFITGLLLDYSPRFIDEQIKRTVELASLGELRSIWSRPPVDFHSHYWLYETLNADEFMAGQKIRLRKLGPFHLTSRIERRVLEVSQNKYRIFYNSSRFFTLNETQARESGQFDVPFLMMNPVYASLIHIVRTRAGRQSKEEGATMMGMANRMAAMYNESLFINTTGREALMGRHVKLIARARKLAEQFGMGAEASAMQENFGFVRNQDNVWDGPYEIYSGYGASASSLGELISYKGKRRFSQFQGRCNRLQASLGELRPMPIDQNQILEMMQPSTCRLLHLVPTRPRQRPEGFTMNYRVSERDFLSALANPDNRCYCITPPANQSSMGGLESAGVGAAEATNASGAPPPPYRPKEIDYCSMNGVVELAPCAHDAPLLINMAGVDLDPRITATIDDFDDDLLAAHVKSLADADLTSQMQILRRVGVPIEADITVRLFVRVLRDPRFRHTVNVPEETFVPLVMVRERARIPPQLGKILVNLEGFLVLSQHVKIVMYLSALVLFAWLSGHQYSRVSAAQTAGGPGAGGSLGGPGGGGPAGAPLSQGRASVAGGANGGGASGGGERARRGRLERDKGAPATGSFGAPSGHSQLVDVGSRLDANEEAEEEEAGAAVAASKAAATEGATDAATAAARRGQSMAGARRLERASRAPNKLQASDANEAGQAEARASETGERAALGAPHAEKRASGWDEGGDGQAAGAHRKTGSARRPGGWLARGWRTVVRAFGGPTSGAAQLVLEPAPRKSDQDRQLELLAERIDNWFTAAADEPASTSPSPADAAGQGAPAKPPVEAPKVARPARGQPPGEPTDTDTDMGAGDRSAAPAEGPGAPEPEGEREPALGERPERAPTTATPFRKQRSQDATSTEAEAEAEAEVEVEAEAEAETEADADSLNTHSTGQAANESDKVAALEKVERALLEPEPALGRARLELQPQLQPEPDAPTMQAEPGAVTGLDGPAAAGARKAEAAAGNETLGADNQSGTIDESSRAWREGERARRSPSARDQPGEPAGENNKLAGAGKAGARPAPGEKSSRPGGEPAGDAPADERASPADCSGGPERNSIGQAGAKAAGLARAHSASGGKDERRDSGVKLDCSGAGSHSSGAPDGDTAPGSSPLLLPLLKPPLVSTLVSESPPASARQSAATATATRDHEEAPPEAPDLELAASAGASGQVEQRPGDGPLNGRHATRPANRLSARPSKLGAGALTKPASAGPFIESPGSPLARARPASPSPGFGFGTGPGPGQGIHPQSGPSAAHNEPARRHHHAPLSRSRANSGGSHSGDAPPVNSDNGNNNSNNNSKSPLRHSPHASYHGTSHLSVAGAPARRHQSQRATSTSTSTSVGTATANGFAHHDAAQLTGRHHQAPRHSRQMAQIAPGARPEALGYAEPAWLGGPGAPGNNISSDKLVGLAS